MVKGAYMLTPRSNCALGDMLAANLTWLLTRRVCWYSYPVPSPFSLVSITTYLDLLLYETD
jgi:hypothetical protein